MHGYGQLVGLREGHQPHHELYTTHRARSRLKQPGRGVFVCDQRHASTSIKTGELNCLQVSYVQAIRQDGVPTSPPPLPARWFVSLEAPHVTHPPTFPPAYCPVALLSP